MHNMNLYTTITKGCKQSLMLEEVVNFWTWSFVLACGIYLNMCICICIVSYLHQVS